jgi:hypothetical protein
MSWGHTRISGARSLSRHLEFASPAEIDEQVHEAIERGGKEGMILGLSATAITSISDRYRDNAIQYIESGLRYGELNGSGR